MHARTRGFTVMVVALVMGMPLRSWAPVKSGIWGVIGLTSQAAHVQGSSAKVSGLLQAYAAASQRGRERLLPRIDGAAAVAARALGELAGAVDTAWASLSVEERAQVLDALAQDTVDLWGLGETAAELGLGEAAPELRVGARTAASIILAHDLHYSKGKIGLIAQ